MLEKIISYGTMIGMAFAVLLWAQANFVDAGDFNQYRYDQIESEVNYLKDKRERLEREGKALSFEDKRKLERLELKLEKLKNSY